MGRLARRANTFWRKFSCFSWKLPESGHALTVMEVVRGEPYVYPK